MIPRLKPLIGLKEIAAAIPKGYDAGIGDVDRFEVAFADVMGQKHAVAFPYGRTGLLFLIEALGLKGREIICPAYTCVVVPHAIVYSKNIPVFVDCEPTGFNMDLEQAESRITSRTGAIIATSLFGYPVDLDKLQKIRSRHPHLHIIQDCAHSFAAEWNGRQVQREGVAAIFGLNISKLITSIFGGMVTTDDDKIYQRLKISIHGKLKPSNWIKELKRTLYLLAIYPTFNRQVYDWVNRIERLKLLNTFVKYYDVNKIDMPDDYLQHMSNVEARTGIINLNRYRKIVENRRSAANYYFSTIQNMNDFILPPRVNGATYSHFVVQVKNRNEWLKKALIKGIQLGWLIEYNIPEMSVYRNNDPSVFPYSYKYARTTINLPVWGGARQAKKVVERLFR